MTATPEQIVDAFTDLIDRTLPRPDAEEATLQRFREQIIAPWNTIELHVRREADALYRKLSPSQLRALRALDVAPDLMGPLRLGRDEVRQVRGLAWLLRQQDPTGLHCLRAFLALIGEREPEVASKVDTEVFLGANGRVDLTLTSRARCTFVEVKIDAAVRAGQLEGYQEAMRRLGVKEARLVLLALHCPARGPGEAHLCITWEEVFAALLPFANMESPTGVWLSAWLRSVAAHLLGLDRPGPTSGWPLGHQLRLLHLITLRPGGADA